MTKNTQLDNVIYPSSIVNKSTSLGRIEQDRLKYYSDGASNGLEPIKSVEINEKEMQDILYLDSSFEDEESVKGLERLLGARIGSLLHPIVYKLQALSNECSKDIKLLNSRESELTYTQKSTDEYINNNDEQWDTSDKLVFGGVFLLFFLSQFIFYSFAHSVFANSISGMADNTPITFIQLELFVVLISALAIKLGMNKFFYKTWNNYINIIVAISAFILFVSFAYLWSSTLSMESTNASISDFHSTLSDASITPEKDPKSTLLFVSLLLEFCVSFLFSGLLLKLWQKRKRPNPDYIDCCNQLNNCRNFITHLKSTKRYIDGLIEPESIQNIPKEILERHKHKLQRMKNARRDKAQQTRYEALSNELPKY